MKTPRIYGQTDWLAGSSLQGWQWWWWWRWFTRDGRAGLKLSLGGRKSARTLPFRRFLREVSLFRTLASTVYTFTLRGRLAVPTRRGFTLASLSLSLSLSLFVSPVIFFFFFPRSFRFWPFLASLSHESKEGRERERERERVYFVSVNFFLFLFIFGSFLLQCFKHREKRGC